MEMQLNIHKFITVCTHLAFESANIIRDVLQSNKLNIVIKDIQRNDPVTEADFKVQTLILRGLRKYWPNLTIVGEEVKDFDGAIDYDYNKLEKTLFKEGLFAKGKNGEQLGQSLDMNKVIVWVDPLDATLSYTNGYLDEVTTLIGLSYENKSKIGIIGLPYRKEAGQEPKYVFDPKVYIGNYFNAGALEMASDLSLKEIKPGKHQADIRLCTTRSKLSSQTQQALSSLSKQITRMGGSGKKGLQVALNNQDTCVYLGRGICNWDVCAPEALLKALEGGCTKSNGETFTYQLSENGDYSIPQGAVMCVDEQLQGQLLSKIVSSKL